MKATVLRRTRTERLCAFTWVGHLPLAFEGARIVAIDTPSEDDVGLDLFDLFGVECPLLKSERRVARLSRDADDAGDDGERALLLGDRVELGAVPDDEVLAPPPFLAGLSTDNGLVGFVRFAGTLFSLFDPARVTKPRDKAS